MTFGMDKTGRRCCLGTEGGTMETERNWFGWKQRVRMETSLVVVLKRLSLTRLQSVRNDEEKFSYLSLDTKK